MVYGVGYRRRGIQSSMRVRTWSNTRTRRQRKVKIHAQ
jgi:hypothetical protein